MDHENRILRCALVAAGLIVVAAIVAVILPEDRAGAQPTSRSPAAVARDPESAGKVIGAACKAEDGYVPERRELRARAKRSEKDGPEFVAVYELDPSLVPLGRSKLPPGQVFCELPDRGNPRGYLTSNCATDADCHDGNRCRLGRCRAPCESDEDCESPTTCQEAASDTDVRHCSCVDCLTSLKREQKGE